MVEKDSYSKADSVNETKRRNNHGQTPIEAYQLMKQVVLRLYVTNELTFCSVTDNNLFLKAKYAI